MAEALLDVVLQNLTSFLHDELATFCGVNREIQRLSETLPLILAVIEDAEKKEITSKPIRLWLRQLKDATHVLDDILDEYSIRSPQQNSGSARQVHCLSLSSFKPNNIWFRYDIGKRLKDISERIDQIAQDGNKYGLIKRDDGIRERPIQVPKWRLTSSLIAEPQVYGRDEDREKIVEFLVRQAPHSSGLSGYPIVGIGGLGKTTLAQLVFNDPRVIKHFGTLRIWVCVSDDFSVISILQSIMESITSQKCDPLNLDTMQRKVQERLQSGRFLLVLDDVWNKNQDQWYQLRSVLECGSNGASVLVTTRDSEVASIMGTHSADQLSSLSEDDCWSLFKQRSFPNDKEVSLELEAIGKEIVKKCGGLPLAAKALGSLLHSESDEKRWLEVLESKLWNLPDKTILPALRLSYFNLTPTLRRCFAFCAIFLKDEVINKEELIHLWMANGFISSREKLDIEDVGHEIWNELYHKSFFQEVVIEDDGHIRFKMHDLVHDLAQSVMGEECFVINGGDRTINSSRSTHHIGYLGYCSSIFDLKEFKKVESLRTLFNLNAYSEINFDKLQTHYSLRVLSGTSPKLPLFSYLIHLRYLEMRGLEVYTIPKSICGLRKLEILKFIDCICLCHLPKGLTTHLQNLRQFIIDRCFALSRMPPNIGKLSRLRTLSLFIVRSKAGHSLAELHDLNLCQRELSIKGLEHVGSIAEAKGVNLIGIKELRVLTLSWEDSESKIKAQNVDVEQVIEALQPDSNLKELVVCRYKGSHFPSWMKDVSCLSNLVSLALVYCKNCVQIPALGKLPSLEKLEIWDMQYAQYMDEDESYDGVEVKAFISLKTLSVGRMPNLERLLKREGGEMFPRLLELRIFDCPKLKLSSLPLSVEDLTIGGCEEELLMLISSLRGLKSLKIESCSKLKELPTQLMSLHALWNLEIRYCDELECIPEQVMEGLHSLRTLGIYDCRAFKSLPEAIQHLTSLHHLVIHGSPILKKRCKEGTGEDWHKIQHISYKSIRRHL